jgi:hypothetical protein
MMTRSQIGEMASLLDDLQRFHDRHGFLGELGRPPGNSPIAAIFLLDLSDAGLVLGEAFFCPTTLNRCCGVTEVEYSHQHFLTQYKVTVEVFVPRSFAV